MDLDQLILTFRFFVTVGGVLALTVLLVLTLVDLWRHG